MNYPNAFKTNVYLSVGEEEQVWIWIECDLVDLELELLLVQDLVAFDVYEGNQVLFVAHCNRFAVLRPVELDQIRLKGKAVWFWLILLTELGLYKM